MSDLIVAFGLVLVIEGLLWALSPALGRHILATAAATPDVGALIVWMVRG